MLPISAIEIENFQSIEQRTRIELKPITLLYGPNSAGKSAVFDAIELLRVLLDPVAIDEQRAASMVDRWARRVSGQKLRKLFLAVEFPYSNLEVYEVWADLENWVGVPRHSTTASFGPPEHEYQGAIGHPLDDQVVRIELTLGVREATNGPACHLIESAWSIGATMALRLTKNYPGASDPWNRVPRADVEVDALSGEKDEVPDDEYHPFFEGMRWLELYEESGFFDFGLIGQIERSLHKGDPDERPSLTRASGFARVNCRTVVTLSPHRLAADDGRMNSIDSQSGICINAKDIMFYLATMLWKPLRNGAAVVRADRRSPRPEEVLTVVDLGLEGWWSTAAMSPSSPAALLKKSNPAIDEHFQGLAAAAHAALLLKTANADFWGGGHAQKHIRPVQTTAAVVERVNHHLERSLFTEKLYRLECASTLMVPIDLNEDDPWSYYALAQPSAVRLFLREPEGQAVELQDVGSGVSYVLPVLHALARQGFVQVQQPELHLHPALQASIADVFIEERWRKGFGQVLIETHSEHLLLRLLRRIRDTENGKALSDDVKLTNEDIGVYYFDPQPGGGTTVSRQLVTPLGDFYTEWPRGFFAERYRDLFDEE